MRKTSDEVRFRLSAHWAALSGRVRKGMKAKPTMHPPDGDLRDASFDRLIYLRGLESYRKSLGLPKV